MKNDKILFASIAANIFFIAFILGGLAKPTNLPFGPPPPFLDVFEIVGHKELMEGFSDMQSRFGEIEKARQDLSKKLYQGPVSKEEVINSFGKIEKVMFEVKDRIQDKAAEKISKLSPEERKKLADKLSEKD